MCSKLSTTLLFTHMSCPCLQNSGIWLYLPRFSNMSAKSSVNTGVFFLASHHLQLRKLIRIGRWYMQYFCNALFHYLANAITILLIPFWPQFCRLFSPWCLQKTRKTPFCTYQCRRIQSPNVAPQVLGCPTHRMPSAALCGMWAIAMGCRSGAMNDSRPEICRTTNHLNFQSVTSQLSS